MIKNRLQKFGPPRRESIGTMEKNTNGPYAGNTSRVVSVETPEGRDGSKILTKPISNSSCIEDDFCFKLTGSGGGDLDSEGRSSTSGSSISSMRTIVPSPMDALRMGMASPFRNFLGFLKPPPPPDASLHGSSEAPSSRASSVSASEIENICLGSLKLTLGAVAEKDQPNIGAEMSSSSVATRLHETRRDGQSLVVVAFDANVKDISHAGIVWAMENVLKRGDILTIVSVLDSVKGPLGYRVKIGDQKWLSANNKLVEEEISHKMKIWKAFPGLEYRCNEGGVRLAVIVKAANRPELAICKEVIKLGANHVVLDKSLKNRRRDFYLQNLNCNVTRMRRSGGVDVIRPSLDMAVAMGLVRNMEPSSAKPRSPTSVIPVVPAPALSYGDQIDEFEISLGGKKLKKILSAPKSPLTSPLSSSTSTHERSTSVSGPSVRPSFTSSLNGTDHDADDDLFSIFHGSTRHRELQSEVDTDLFSFHGSTRFTEPDTDLFSNLKPPVSGYESDDLFSIGNASARRAPPGLPLDAKHQTLRHSIPDNIVRNSRLSSDAITSSSSEIAMVSEPLKQATISRVTFVAGLGEAVEINLRSALRPGEGLLVGSSPSALFLMYSEQQRNSMSTGTPGSYIAMEGRMAMKLAYLESDQRVLAVDTLGRCRTIPVGHAITHAKALVLIEAHSEGRRHSVMLHHTDSMCLSRAESGELVPVQKLKVGDEVLLRLRSVEPSHAIWS